MGEIQGSVWTTMLFVTLFFGMVAIIFWALDVMDYNSSVYTIEDNLKAGNLEVFDTLDDKLSPCPAAYDTNTNCTGITENNINSHYIKYQISYDGKMLNIDASGDQDNIVLLPY